MGYVRLTSDERPGLVLELRVLSTWRERLLGLLGTVFGMIDTFSAVASAPGGVEMTALADGIWQALITTAAGLSIAIPTILGLSYFESRVDDVTERLNRAGDLILDGDSA